MSLQPTEESFHLGEWNVEPSLNRISRGEEIVKIDPRNMRVLQLLASRPGRVFSQAEIEQAVWDGLIVTTNSVYQSITQLRRALRDHSRSCKYIETIPKKGYRLVAPVSPISPTRPEAQKPSPDGAEEHRRARELRTSSRRYVSALLVAIVVVTTTFLALRSPHERAPAALNGQSQSSANLGELLAPQAEQTSPRLLRDLGYAALAQGKHHEAREYFLKVLDIERGRVGHWHPAVGSLLSELANVAVWGYDYDSAERYAREALSIFERVPAPHHDKIVAVRQLGYVLLEAGKYDEAEIALTQALNESRRAFSDTEWNTTAVLLSDLASLRFAQNRPSESEQLARESLQLLRRIFDDEVLVARASTLLSRALIAQKRYLEAKQEAESILTVLHVHFTEDHAYILAARDLIAQSLLGLGEHRIAEDLLRRNIELWRQNGMSQRAAASLSALGEALLGQGRISEAEGCLLRASTEINGVSAAREEQQWFSEHKARLSQLQLVKAQLQGSGSHLADAREGQPLLDDEGL